MPTAFLMLFLLTALDHPQLRPAGAPAEVADRAASSHADHEPSSRPRPSRPLVRCEPIGPRTILESYVPAAHPACPGRVAGP